MKIVHPLVEVLSKMNKKIKKDELIMCHIKAEERFTHKNEIDEFHSNLFRGYTTLKGYKFRYKKFNTDGMIRYPYGTALLGVALIMDKFKDPNMARMEAQILCTHSQSLLAVEALIALMEKKDLHTVLQLVNYDKEIYKVCRGDYTLETTNVDFMQEWCRHYLLAALDGYRNNPLPSQFLSHIRHRTLCLIYYTVRDAFHPPLNQGCSLNQQDPLPINQPNSS